jgi:hypothetical protein
VNHVSDEAVAALESFGQSILAGEPGSLAVDLRSDVRVRIDWDESDLAAGEATIEYVVEHDHPADTLRGFGSFVETRVDGVETTLAEWGVESPDDYDRTGTEGWNGAVYAGRLDLP